MSGSERPRARTDSIRPKLPAWLDSSSYPVGVVDEHGIIAYANKAATNTFEVRAEQVLGRRALEFIDPTNHRIYRSHRRRVRGAQREPYVLRFGLREEPKRDFLVVAEAFRDETGEFRGSIAVFLELPVLAAQIIVATNHLERAAAEGRDLLKRIQPAPRLEHLFPN